MTFSVDLDFWPMAGSPAQDATSRLSPEPGRGKDFAASLLSLAPTDTPELTPLVGDGGAITLASLNLIQTPADTADLPAISLEMAPAPAAGTEGAEILTGGMLAAEPEPGAAISPDAADLTQTPAEPEAEAALKGGSEPLPDLASEITDESDADIDPEAADETLAAAMAPPARAETATSAPTEIQTADEADPSSDAEAAPESATADNSSAPAPQIIAAAAPAHANIRQAFTGSGGAMQMSEISSVRRSDGRAGALPGQTAPSVSPAAAEAAPLTLDETKETASDAAGLLTADTDDAGQTGGELKTAAADTASPTSGQASASPLMAPGTNPASSAPAQTAAVTPGATFTPTNAVMVATSAQLPEIVAKATSDQNDDRIVVQLDPPELGRVSIDFKFDPQGLQHITVTAESPEAMRQLRLMHFELVQALERNGLSGQNMTFQHQNPQQDNSWTQQSRMAGDKFDTPALTGSGLLIAADSGPQRLASTGGRLDIRL